jgi:uncharacterized protein YfdQ (DUF2303 family)
MHLVKCIWSMFRQNKWLSYISKKNIQMQLHFLIDIFRKMKYKNTKNEKSIYLFGAKLHYFYLTVM